MPPAAASRPTCPGRSPTARCSTPTTATTTPTSALRSLPLKTNTVSNTAFRGFGGPQGMVAGERVIEEIAYALGKDPLEVRKLNFYGDRRAQRHALPPDGRGQHHRPSSSASSKQSADYRGRRAGDPRAQREQPRCSSAGIALTPVKFGISFTATQYNQAGALVHVYTDGSDPPEPRRHRDGAGALHQGRPGGRRGVPGRHRPGPDHRHHHRQGAEHLGHRRLLRHRPQRHGGPGRGAHDQGAAGRLRRRALGGARGAGRVPARPRPGRQPGDPVRASWSGRPTWPASRSPPPASTRRRRSTGTARPAAAGRSTTSPTAPRAARSRSTR